MGWFKKLTGTVSHAASSISHTASGVARVALKPVEAVAHTVLKPVEVVSAAVEKKVASGVHAVAAAASTVVEDAKKIEHAAESVVNHVAADARALESAGLRGVNDISNLVHSGASAAGSIFGSLANFLPYILLGGGALAALYVYGQMPKKDKDRRK